MMGLMTTGRGGDLAQNNDNKDGDGDKNHHG
jgi:hypothetical protein